MSKGVYRSTNFGQTWAISAVNSSFNTTSSGEPALWWCVSSSVVNNVIVAGSNGVAMSTDHGLNYNTLIYSETHVNAVACDSQCYKILFATDSTVLFAYKYGAMRYNCTQLPNSRYVAVATSRNTLTSIAAQEFGQLYKLANVISYTATWKPAASIVASWSAVATSYDGNVAAASSYDQGVFVSTDSG